MTLEHVVGWAVFRGIRFTVEEGVFVPRPRSELLVEEAASLVRCMTAGTDRRVVVVDLCCGVGAIGGVLVASPPYVPADEIRLLAAEAREFEPPDALGGGPDGLDVARRIAREARQWLSADGCLALEVGEVQADLAAALLEGLGYPTRAVTRDADGAAVVVGRRPR